MIVLGVDPPNAVAVVNGDKLLHLARWAKSPDEWALCKQVQKAVGIAVRLGAEALAIEGQFGEWRDSVEKKKRAGLVRSALVLSGRSGFFRMEWLRVTLGKPIKIYAPGEWRKPVLGRCGNTSAQKKAAAIQMVEGIYGVQGCDDDCADAIGLARALSLGVIT